MIILITAEGTVLILICWEMNIDWGKIEFDIRLSALDSRTVQEAVVDIPNVIS